MLVVDTPLFRNFIKNSLFTHRLTFQARFLELGLMNRNCFASYEPFILKHERLNSLPSVLYMKGTALKYYKVMRKHVALATVQIKIEDEILQSRIFHNVE